MEFVPLKATSFCSVIQYKSVKVLNFAMLAANWNNDNLFFHVTEVSE